MMIERTEYMNRLAYLKDKKVIKIITGIRRCGKSTLMEMFRDKLIRSGVPESNIIYINFEDYEKYDLRNPSALHSYVTESLCEGMNYVFFDEIQHVNDFTAVVDSLFIKKNVDLYLTGSNAYMLSSELATFISGRYIELPMLPLSFSEYVSATGDERDLTRKYVDYVENSSFPYTLELRGNDSELRAYLEGIYNTVVVKDIALRKKISDNMMLESVTRFMLDNIGNVMSTKKIADSMTSSGRKIDVKTVEKYISALTESFIIYKAKRYNVKGKQYLKTLDKYYAVDIGLRYSLLGSRSADVGHILENIVYLELLRRGYDVCIGKVDDCEVDFVAMKGRDIMYLQVAASVRDKSTLERELRPLMKIDDNYPKIILTLDDDPACDYDGIKRLNALEWLLGRV